MQKEKIKKLNNLYLIFLIIVMIIGIVFSFRTGMKVYYLINTNLNDKDVPVEADIADWNFDVRIEY